MRGNLETVDALVSAVTTIERQKRDAVIDTRDLAYDEGGHMLVGDAGLHRLDQYADGQIADRLGIPRKLWNRLGSDYSGLKTTLVNGMWNQKPERRFVRMLEKPDERLVRAYLSDRFRPIDNMLVLSALLPTMQEQGEVKVVSKAMTPTRMYLQVVFPQIQMDVQEGDPVCAGVTITNSEIGAGAVDIATTVWRLICKNGMVGESILRRHHVGARIDLNSESTYDVFQEDTIRAEIESLRLRLRDVFAEAMKLAAFEDRVARLRSAADQKIEDPLAAAKNVTERFGLTEDVPGILLQNMAEEREYSRYGLANSLTWYAQRLDDRDRQYDLEKAGSTVIDMPARDWKQIAEVA